MWFKRSILNCDADAERVILSGLHGIKTDSEASAESESGITPPSKLALKQLLFYFGHTCTL